VRPDRADVEPRPLAVFRPRRLQRHRPPAADAGRAEGRNPT
jgi:hypothetical protein